MNPFSSISLPRDNSLFGRSQTAKFVLTVLSLFLCFNFQVSAVVVSHQWQESHRGYSLEQIPGTGIAGAPLEYVAAGTIYTNGPGRRAGWHFMRIDEFGNVLASRVAYCTTVDEEFRVVDITVESATKFWITSQSRHLVSAAQYDYIYIAGVDQNGNDLPLNPAIVISSSAGNNYFRQLYPTHTLFLGDALYICGYAADNTQSPSQPDALYTIKAGMFIKCAVNGTPVTTTSLFWDSANSFPGPGDFDMALRISPSLGGTGYQPDFPLLVTGAVNNGDGYISGILAMKFDNNATLLTANTYLPTLFGMSYFPPRVTGAYGVDMRGPLSVEPEEDMGGYCILTNYFDEDNPNNRTWGLLRVKNDLTVYNTATNYSYVGLTDNKSWATQFTSAQYVDKGRGVTVNVLGQQTELFSGGEQGGCDSLYSPSLSPSFTNINPFVSYAPIAGTGIWDYTNGFGWTYPTSNWGTNIIHLSSKGTKSNDMDYFAGSLGAGAMLEDVTRLYTFGAGSHYYTGWSTTNFKYPGIIAPVGEFPGTASSHPYLSTKLIKTDIGQESTCHNFYRDCPSLITSTTSSNDPFALVPMELDVIDGYSIFSLNNSNFIPNGIDCSTGYYKTTGTETVTGVMGDLKIYPNPATNELNIQLVKPLTATDLFEFTLTDITGKQVYNMNKARQGEQLIHVILPDLVQGMYIGMVTLNGVKYNQKITIK